MTSQAAQEQTRRRYRAFISYSHADRGWGAWFHRELETFGAPAPLKRALKEKASLKPIFRDDAETASSPDLGDVIRDALRRSEALIVLCSPQSARSRWVDQEIRDFKALGRSDRIFPVIIDGKPHDPDRECFPPALKLKAGPDGALTDEPAEPLAVDIRAHGRRDTLLKLIAGLLGVDYDTLKRRDQIRARQRAAALIGGVTAALTIYAGTVFYQARAAGELSSLVLSELARLAANDAASPELEADRGATYDRALRFAALGARADLLSPAAPGAAAQLARAAHASHAAGRLRGHADIVSDLHFSAAGARLISGSFDLTPRLWSTESGQTLAPLVERDGEEFAVRGAIAYRMLARLSPDGAWAASTRLDGGVLLSDGRTGAPLGLLGAPEHFEGFVRPAELAFSPAALELAYGDDDGVISIFDLESRTLARRLRGHEGVYGELGPLGVGELRYSPDGVRLLSRAGDEVTILWDAATGQEIARRADAAPNASVFLADGQAAHWAMSARELALRDFGSGAPLHKLSLAELSGDADFTPLAAERTGPTALSLGGRFAVYVFPGRGDLLVVDAETGAAGWIEREGETSWFVAVSPTDGTVAVGVNRVTVELYAFGGAFLGRLEGHAEQVRILAFSPDGGLLATADRGGEILLWRPPPAPRRLAADAEIEARLAASMAPPAGYEMSFDAFAEPRPDARLLRDGAPALSVAMGVNDLVDDRFAVHGATGRAAVLVTSQASDAWTVRVYDLASGALGSRIVYPGRDPDGGFEVVKSLHFSKDGARLALRGDLGVYLHDVATGVELARFAPPRLGQPDAVAFADDGARVWVRGGGGAVFEWPTPWLAGPGDRAAAGAPPLLADACARKLGAGLARLTEEDAAGAPVLRGRVGEDVCNPPDLLARLTALWR